MKAITMKVSALLPVWATARIKNPLSWAKFTNLFNAISESDYSVVEMKQIVALASMLLCLCYVYAWPLSLFPGIYLMRKGGKR